MPASSSHMASGSELGAIAQAVQHDDSSARCSPFALFSLPPMKCLIPRLVATQSAKEASVRDLSSRCTATEAPFAGEESSAGEESEFPLVPGFELSQLEQPSDRGASRAVAAHGRDEGAQALVKDRVYIHCTSAAADLESYHAGFRPGSRPPG
eukprot:CAMPEP_0173063680 /NCGR_PEP_ID=MMETSP1102-20130122/4534_1 /TAXON_ID=49646 /ORGANISM="Geminigera sp., Strain Caron Lab Isolate" /LENGTH=152 /DNA_ID=CAMNT_0013930541 /DNA_START=348 /DNA_END=807 /DNA_ORIENTATION=+